MQRFLLLNTRDPGHTPPLHLVVEIKGYRGEDAAARTGTMNTLNTYSVPGVNHLASHGRWAFAEFGDVYEMEDDFAERVDAEIDTMIKTQMAEARVP